MSEKNNSGHGNIFQIQCTELFKVAVRIKLGNGHSKGLGIQRGQQPDQMALREEDSRGMGKEGPASYML